MRLDDFTTVWVIDFEFRGAPGERRDPVCLVAHELRSGRKLRVWEDELKSNPCPYDLGPNSLVVAYYASAEMVCHLALGWPLPCNVLDLYAEFRVETNGRELKASNGLLGALAYYQLNGIDAVEKDQMRDLILSGGPYSEAQRQAILEYCESDVIATGELFNAMSSVLDREPRLPHSLLRGRYGRAVGRMEHAGVPIDAELFADLQRNWDSLKSRLIERIDAQFHVYEGRTFKLAKFADYLTRNNIAWPILPSGQLALDDDTFSEQCKSHPQLLPLKELRRAMGKFRMSDLPVGSDGRNREMLSMFRSTTGRNQPSTSRFVFGLSAWLRGLMRPEPGYGLAYIDWSQQEFGIAAALSGDLRMQEAYMSGDPYLAFARQAGAVPPNATKQSHAKEREQFKACVLAVQYGMREESLGRRIQQPAVYAKELLRLHRQTYATFWEWSDATLNYAYMHGKLWTVLGWELHVGSGANSRSLANFPMQANGAEMLRLACCLTTEAGVEVVAPVHDALLIHAPLEELEARAEQAQELMRQASRIVLSGFELRSDVKFIRWPERFEDERGIVMWDTVQTLLAEIRQGTEER
jgi:DNA polymerase-1